MKNVVLILVIILCVSCIKQEKTVYQSPVPENVDEWQIALKKKVGEQKQEIEDYYLPEEVSTIFPDSILRQIEYSANALKIVNNLPGNACDGVISATFTCWPLVERQWYHSMNPTNYLYVIKYMGQLLALTFPNDSTLNCKKILYPSGDERPISIKLPKFEEDVIWEWSFWGLPYEATSLAQGKIIEYSAQNGFTSVKTSWKGGTDYTLSPKASTYITANGVSVYCE